MYVIVKRENKFDVFEGDADQKPVGDSLGQFDTEDDAQAKVRELRAGSETPDEDEAEASEADSPAAPDEKAAPVVEGSKYDGGMNSPYAGDFTIPGEAYKFTQAETDYTMYAVRRAPVNAVCQTCRNFTARRTREGAFVRHECAIVECHPLDIVPTGWCSKWTERPQETMTPPLEVVVIGDISEDEEAEAVGEMSARADNRTLGRFPASQVLKEMERRGASSAFKALGNRVWIAAHTNAYEDKQKEIIPLVEHKRHVARVKAGLWPMPELWHWHIKGTSHGKALWYDMMGNMVVAVGLFHDTPAGRAAEKAYMEAKPGEVTMSHGFFYDPREKQGGVYGTYNTFEITTLWAGAEANPYTAFQTVKELSMGHVSPQQEASLKRIFGDQADGIIKNLEPIGDADEALKALGIAHKEFAADVTEDAIDAAQAEAAKSDEGDTTILLGEMLKTQGATAGQLVRLIAGLDKVVKRLDRVDAQLENPPLAVTDSKTLDEGDGVDATAQQKAADELREKQKSQPPTDAWENFLPGLL
jgi:hypothetical protein